MDLIERLKKKKIINEDNTFNANKEERKEGIKQFTETTERQTITKYNGGINIPNARHVSTNSINNDTFNRLKNFSRQAMINPYNAYKSIPNEVKGSVWNRVQNTMNDLGRTADNTWNGLKNGILSFRSQLDRVSQNNPTNNAMKMNNEIWEKRLEKDPNNEIAKKMIESNNNFLFKQENASKSYQNNLRERMKKNNEKILKNTEQIDNKAIKKVSELAPSIGQMLPSFLPGAGAIYSAGSASGQYYEDGKERGMSDKEAEEYASIMGLAEGTTEMIGISNLKKAGKGVKTLVKGGSKETAKEISKSTLKKALKDYGVGIADNVMQEAIIEPIQEITATATAGKDKAKWDNMGQRMLESGINGGLVSAILGGGNIGIESCVGVIEKINNGQKPTKIEIQQAVKDASKQLDTTKIITDSVQQQVSKISQQQNQNALETNVARENTQENQNSSMLISKQFPTQNYQYEKTGNSKIDTMNEQAGKYFNNSERTQNYMNMLTKIVKDKNVEIRFDANLTDSQGNIANGKYENGVITINPNSNRTGEFIAVHELTHAIGTDSMRNIIENYRKSNAEFDNAVKSLLKNYNTTELTDEAMADVSAQLLGNQEYINNLAQTNPNLFQKIYSEIKYLWHQFRGYKNQDQFIEDLQYKWEQAYRNNNKLNETTNYYIEPVAKFNEAEYNNIIQEKLSKREYAILRDIINRDSNIKPGINYVDVTNGRYTVYYKDFDDFKVMSKEMDEDAGRINERNDTARGERRYSGSLKQNIENKGTTTSNDEISNINTQGTRERSGSNTGSSTNIQSIENSNKSSFSMDNKGRKLSKEQQDRYKYMSNELRDENGNIKNYYHGTKRADRVGNIFDPNKATSGPMAFFTDNEDIAKSYSENKQDTSLSREYDTEYDLFKINNKSLDEYWNSLSKEQQNKINQEGYNIGLDEDFENIVHEKDASKNSFSSQYEYYLKNEENNNGIKALYDVFIQDGNLMFEDIKKFEDVLKYAGIDNIQYLDPYKVDSKVYNVYLNIKNPFNTSNITSDMIDKFKEASKNAKKGESYSADQWDKTNISPEQWISRLDDDIKNGTSHAWTSIPDWVTEVLKKNGYDGIVDKGGKNGGEEHQVVIPFYSEQIKNVDNTNPTDNPDIRYSKNNQEWQEYLDKNIEPKGTRTNLKDIRLPVKKEIKLPTQQKVNSDTITNNYMQNSENNTPSKGETINYAEMERPEGKIRKHYKSIIESSNTTPEAKKIAKELMGSDTYVPESNKSQIDRADNFIEKYGIEKAVDRLITNVETDDIKYDGVFKKVGVDDIALGERLIQYFSKTGDATNLQNVIQATAMAGTQAGRAVQLLSIINHQTPTGQVTWIQRNVDKVNKELQQKFKNKKNIPQFDFNAEMQQKILSSENQEQMYNNINEVYEELGQQVPKTFSEQIDEWRYFSMLANLKTHGRNIIGNTAMNITQRTKNKVAGAIEGAVAKFNPEMERTHTLKRTSKEVKEFAKNDFKNIDVQTSLGMNENKYNPQSRLQNARKTFKNDALNKTVGKLFDLNSTALEVEDNIGLKAMYVNALGEYITANKIDINNMTDEQLSKARQHAIKEAQEATFHQASALATALNQMGRKNKITKFALDAAVPFKKTPVNVAKTGVQYSPVGLMKSAIFDVGKVRRGDISINQYVDNISKGLTGTGIAYMGYVLAEAGILKASGGDDDKKENYDEEQGKQTYSITLGGKTASLDWLSPVGIPLFVGAEINQQFNTSKKEKNSKSNDDDELLSKAVRKVGDVGSALSNIINPMTEMSMISGLTGILSSYNKENAVGDAVVNSGTSYINQFIPTSLSQFARTTDEYERTTKSTKTGTLPKAIDRTVNQIKSKVPGLRQQLPIKTDVWGKEVKQHENLPIRAFNNFLNPSNVKNISTDEVDKELNNLYAKTGEKSIIPKAIEKKYTIDGTDYIMTDEEYAKYNKKYGETSYKLIKDLIKSNDYKNMTDEQKQKAIENTYSYAKELNKIDYANNNKINSKSSTLYKTMDALKDIEGGQLSYIDFTAKTKDIESDIDKAMILFESNYSEKVKKAVYENTIGKITDEIEAKNKKANISNDTYNTYKYELAKLKIKKINNKEIDKKDNLKDTDKMQVLLDSKLSKKDRQLIYENYIKSKPKEGEVDTYKALKENGININEYLKYKQQGFESDKEDDGTLKGKSVSGSKKTKMFDYVNENITGYGNRLILLGAQYKLNSNERQKLYETINKLPNTTKDEKMKLLDKMQGFTVYKDGTVTF